MDIDAMNRRFAIPGAARFEPGQGGMPRLVISTALADAEIYIHGAHVTSYTPHVQDNQPLLFLSKEAVFQPGKAIRGGIPICFPWFGPRAIDPKAPAHGFVRNKEWTIESVSNYSGEVAAIFAVGSDDETRAFWPHDFTARYTVTVGTRLQLSLEITNTGPNVFDFEEALHTYLAIGDIHQISVDGLAGTTYLDKMNNAQPTQEGQQPIRFVGETDRVYLNTRSTCRVTDPVMKRVISIEKTGSDTTVVWNPWINKSKSFTDFGDDEWPGMVCVESCNVGKLGLMLAPTASQVMTATIWSEAIVS